MNHARAFDIVQPLVANILKGRVLVGHDIYHDLSVLRLKHPKRDIRDTVMLRDFRRYANGGKPSLSVLAYEILGLEVHQGVHSSIEDARVTMALFRSFKPQFDSDHIARFPNSSPARHRGSPAAKLEKGGKKKKKKSNKNNRKKKSKGQGKKS
jgi:RNA exonuclease 4